MPVLKNARHERFAQELARGSSLLDAYARAGYGRHGTAAGLLRANRTVEARYLELMQAAARQTEVTAASVINELAKLAFANISDFIRVDEAGIPQPDFTRMTREQAAAVVEITVNEFESGRSAEGRAMRRMRFKLADKRAALADLGKMLGLFRQHVEVTGRGGGPVETQQISDFDAARRIAFVLAKASVKTRPETPPPGAVQPPPR